MSSAASTGVSRDARDARNARKAREAWAGAVIAKARVDIKAARKHSTSRLENKRAAAGDDEAPGRPPRLCSFSAARRTASAMAGLAAVEAAVARASLLFAESAGADSGFLRSRMALASTGAAEALSFAAAVEKAAFDATEETATKAARAASSASKISAEITEARKALSETSDRERLKRLVIEIARLERQRSDDIAEFKVSAEYPVFTMIDRFGLDAAAAKVEAGSSGNAGSRAGSDQRGGGAGGTAGAVGTPAGGASAEAAVIPPFHFHTEGDQLQWPFAAAS